jgi:uncharacterized protein (TIGR03437 family)
LTAHLSLSCGQPAGAGDYIQIYVTGLGRATPGGDPNGKVLPTGSVAPADGSVLYQTVQNPTVTIGGGRLRSKDSARVHGDVNF